MLHTYIPKIRENVLKRFVLLMIGKVQIDKKEKGRDNFSSVCLHTLVDEEMSAVVHS